MRFLSLAILLGSFSLQAFAQQTNTQIDDKSSSQALAPIVSEAQKNWSGSYAVSGMTYVEDQSKFGSGAPIAADDYIALDYKASKTLTYELGYNFTTINNNTHAYQPYYSHSGAIGQDPEIILKQTLGSIGSSDPVGMAYAYYIPVSTFSQQQRGGYGTLRVDASTNFNMGGKVSLMPFESMRIYLNTAQDAAGPDAIYRFNLGGAAMYNFSKTFNAYAWPQLDLRSSTINHGTLSFDVLNRYQTEVGLNYTVKLASNDITINPAIVNYVHLENGQGLGKSSYADASGLNGYTPTAEIDLNIGGNF